MKANLLLAALAVCTNSMAQNTTEIQSWTSQHPDVYIMELQVYNSISMDFKNKIEGNVIVYDQTLDLSLLEAFDQLKSNQSSKETAIKVSQDQEMKDWLSNHTDVKILTRSYYNSCDLETQEIYVQNGALVLIGEVITLEDIRNY